MCVSTMKTAGAALLMLCFGLPVVADHDQDANQTTTAATDFTQQTYHPDVHAVLKEMSILYKYTKSQMEAIEARLKASEGKAESLETRLRTSDKTVKDLKKLQKKQDERAESLETRLSTKCEDSRGDICDIYAGVKKCSEVIKQLQERQQEQTGAIEAVGERVNTTGSQVEELRRAREEGKVSFSASLLADGKGHTGPFHSAPTLVYKHVITNIGSHYNPNTRIFTAPVRGVYYFLVFVHGGGKGTISTGVGLYKNGEPVVIAFAHQPSHSVNPSNGASLLLEVGDVVEVKLWRGSWVWDGPSHHTTFSGHLLFSRESHQECFLRSILFSVKKLYGCNGYFGQDCQSARFRWCTDLVHSTFLDYTPQSCR
ncbi:hypothetical protein ACEWY4_020171 [Coilia grayii]|uniref:C1q domain-containing protein n=1 Tax=Coilia grayii TaxID=363190 RepID=A0ABD1JBU4_9TELE